MLTSALGYRSPKCHRVRSTRNWLLEESAELRPPGVLHVHNQQIAWTIFEVLANLRVVPPVDRQHHGFIEFPLPVDRPVHPVRERVRVPASPVWIALWVPVVRNAAQPA